MKILVTGGAGFIGSCVVRQALQDPKLQIVNVDKLTYAGNLASLGEAEKNPNYHFCQTDICEPAALDRVFADHSPDAVMHLAAESHVDRSIDGPETFMHTNIMGTYQLLDLTPLGRHETNPAYPMDWVRHHDGYVPSQPLTGSAAAPAAQAPQPSPAHTAPGGCCAARG